MFTFKKRAATLKKLSKFETIHSFYQERANFKNALSLTLRKSCKQFCFSPQKNSENQKMSLDKLDPMTYLSYPSLYSSKKMSFQKLFENRKILNQRGRKINESQKKHHLKMIALQELRRIQKNDSDSYLLRNGVRMKLGKNLLKTDLSCRGLNFQMCETSCDQKSQFIRKIKRVRNDCTRMTQPHKYNRMCTMPEFKQDIDIKLCPWEAGE